jgi:hypothetical protein
MKCDHPKCKSKEAIFGYIDDGRETYIPFLCMKHWKEISELTGKPLSDFLG